MIFPRMSALSEVLWSGKEKKNWSDFEKRLQMQFKRYDLWNANYSKAYFFPKVSVAPTENHQDIQWVISSKADKPIAIFATSMSIATEMDSVPVYNVYDVSRITGYKISKPGDSVLHTVWFRNGNLAVNKSGLYTAEIYGTRVSGWDHVREKYPFAILHQRFYLNKATGKR